jgi:SAM-dependent methyltransferase
VHEVAVPGENPDVDTPGDLAALEWGERVRANREQVDRVREVPDDEDFYAPLTHRFRDDPRRSDDDVLDVLRALVRPGETWLDIGAGAGRFALPIALLAGEVIAVDASAGMLAALREGMAEHGIGNVRIVQGRWPLEPGAHGASGASGAEAPSRPRILADVALIANVGYDIEAIGPFLDAMEASARRMCVAVLMDRQPASVAEQFWPAVHGEERATLPGLAEFLDLLRARGACPSLVSLERPPRGFPAEEALVEFIRRQLWVAPGSARDGRLRELIRAELVDRPGGVGLRGQRPSRVGVVRWGPRREE